MAYNIYFIKSGLSVQFKVNTSDNPDSYLWEFGDGGSANLKEPTHTYELTGLYPIKFTATKEGESTVIEKFIGVNEDPELLIGNVPLRDLIVSHLPTGLSPTNYEYDVNNSITKWQLFLQPLVNRVIDNNNVFNEAYYTALENYLISQLVARDFILFAFNQYMVGLNARVIESNDGEGTELKSVRTGSAEAQWYSSSDVWGDMMSERGAFSLLTNSICTLSHRLRIILHFCAPLVKDVYPPSVYRKPKVIIRNPFDKSRM